MRDSKIEWTDHTFNPWWGCTKVSPACDNCYAEAWAKRTGQHVWGYRQDRRRLSDAYWSQPLVWDAEAKTTGRKRVFCASMADVFEWRPDLKDLRERLWRLIEDTPELDWLLLTKRPHLIDKLAPWSTHWPANVWVGTTVEDQAAALKRIPKLIATNAKIKFLSCEPLLSQVALDPWINDIDWVIAGGETGAQARPTDPLWFLTLKNICIRHDVPFHFKQWGDWLPLDERLNIPISGNVRVSDGRRFVKLGKKHTGRVLDGRTWDQVPAR